MPLLENEGACLETLDVKIKCYSIESLVCDLCIYMDKQTVYKHLSSHSKKREDFKITWKILHANIRNLDERKNVEAVEIRNHKLICLKAIYLSILNATTFVKTGVYINIYIYIYL